MICLFGVFRIHKIGSHLMKTAIQMKMEINYKEFMMKYIY